MSFDESKFRSNVANALSIVKKVLDNNRNPQYPADVAHEYEDKYLLAEFLTNTSVATVYQILETLGCSDKIFATLKKWSAGRSVTLRLKAEETCKFLREETREVESSTSHVTEWSGDFNAKRVSKTITKITEYFWQFDFKYSLLAYEGNQPEQGVELQGRAGTLELKTSAKVTPRKESVVRPSIDVNITWFLQRMDSVSSYNFKIDRTAKSCHTPRRNSEIGSALSQFSSFSSWAGQVRNYFLSELFPVHSGHGLDLSTINDTGVFVPVVPLFESNEVKDSSSTALVLASGPSKLLPIKYLDSFLKEEKRSLAEKFRDLDKVFPTNNKVVTVAEANLLVVTLHIQKVCDHFESGVDYIEDMLRKQLIAAIGKVVGPVDFANYMRFHNRKMFKPMYQPRPFSYAIRRPDHYPEGIVSIEAQLADGSLMEPIHTTVSASVAKRPFKFSLDAATQASFYGERYLHGWVSHQFSGVSGMTLQLIARARQFSSFILLAGRIVSADVFEPKCAVIIQNKDDLRIPLILETIPTPKQFRDAISSLSPEQQRFAKAFRGMQLESSLFGVVIIQIKPQLEKLLKIPNDSLTKEIRLTEDLLNLFIEYQIPSDLISYNGAEDVGAKEKVAVVLGHVKKMQDMIANSKAEELKEAAQKAVMNTLAPTSSSSFAFGGGGGPPRPMPMMAMPSPPSLGGAPGSGGAAPPSPAPSPPEAAPDPKQLSNESGGDGAADVVDYTKIPKEMDTKFEKLDVDGALHTTIINIEKHWNKEYQPGLLSAPRSMGLGIDEQKKEKNKAFDLLDALTKSGVLPIDQAEMHIVIAATHTFDQSLMNTLIQDNINPIEKLERSSLIVASSIHGTEPALMIKDEVRERVETYSPGLFIDAPAAVPALEGKKK